MMASSICVRASIGWLVGMATTVPIPALAASLTADHVDGPFSRPISEATQPVKSEYGYDGIVRCLYYPTFTVKELDYGEIGDQAISVTPVRGKSTSRCGRQDDPGEILLPHTQGSYFRGAEGAFVYTFSALGGDTNSFSIFDATRGKPLYSDKLIGNNLASASLSKGALTLTYVRGVQAPCSILATGPACWGQIAHEARLPAAIAALPPPVEACRVSYRKAGARFDSNDPSVISYEVTVQIDPSGLSKVISRGELACAPAL